MTRGSVIGAAVAVAAVPYSTVQGLLTPEGAAILLGIAEGGGVSIGVDADQSLVWMHGEFWYQGEYRYAAHPSGTEVTYRIRNISGWPDLAISLWQRRTLRNQQRQLHQYVAGLAERL